MKIRDIMTTEVATAAPDTSLEEIATMMKEKDTGAIPIVDEDEQLAGIVTDRDIVVRGIAEGKDPTETTAEDILSGELETVEPEADVKQAAEIMARRQIRRLPVVEKGRLVGIVSLGDIAVKRGDDRVSGETLEDVSKGVKGGARKAPAKGSSPAARRRDARGSAGEDRQTRMAEQGGRSQVRTGKRGRSDAGTGGGGRNQPEIAAGGRPGAHARPARREAQGIANQRKQEEDRRQHKVVSIREEAKTPARRRRTG